MVFNIEVRPYRPGDEEGIVDLLQLVFNGWPQQNLRCSPVDHWRWKFLDNPLGAVISSLALENGKVIGCVHGSHRKVKVGGDIVLSLIGADLALHPDFRGRGLTKEIDKVQSNLEKEAGIDFAYWVSINPVVMKLLDKEGYLRFPRTILNLTMIRNIALHLEKMPIKGAWMKRLGYHLLTNLIKIGNTLRGSMHINPNIEVLEIVRFDERIDDFWEAVSEHYDFIVERRKEYLNWRYCDPRGGDFVVKQAEEKGKIIGYSVLNNIHMHREDYAVGHIVDLITLPDRYDALDALVADAVQFFDSNNINLVIYQMVRGHPYEGIVKRRGFLNSRVNIFLALKTMKMGESLRELKKSPARRIFVSCGDQDI